MSLKRQIPDDDPMTVLLLEVMMDEILKPKPVNDAKDSRHSHGKSSPAVRRKKRIALPDEQVARDHAMLSSLPVARNQ